MPSKCESCGELSANYYPMVARGSGVGLSVCTDCAIRLIRAGWRQCMSNDNKIPTNPMPGKNKPPSQRVRELLRKLNFGSDAYYNFRDLANELEQEEGQ